MRTVNVMARTMWWRALRLRDAASHSSSPDTGSLAVPVQGHLA